ncbi:DNA-directed RNA polymerase I subunit RPA34.5-domain-containing protein [Xylaria flabelliformis]|nr:DNA-directed RNA polymerase I subunit RPA34.5-domain-containing protein [Xylaria flabelliformis]
MRSTKANIGSLSSMANKVRQEKKNSASAKSKALLARARESKKPFKSANTVDESSSDSDSSSDDGNSSGSGSDVDAARAKFLASKAAKQNKNNKTAEQKVNGAKSAATPVKPAANGSASASAQKSAEESSSDSESESGSDTSDSGGAPSKTVTSKQSSTTSKAKRGSSSESTSSSGSSDEDDEIGEKNNAVNKNQALAREQSEESDSSSDDEMPDAGTETKVKGVAKGAVVDAEGSSSEESDSGSESDDEGDGGKTAVARTNGKDVTKESVSQVSRAQWLNNSDFMLRKASSDNPGKEVADFFSNANLEGKQVWYFTAPASLPITVLKDMEIDLSKATNGGSLLTHNGDNYGLDLESYATNTQIQLLIPSSGGDKYTSLNHGIDSTVHLRRMAKFGPGGEVHATATDNYVPVPKPVREQPEGLRVRYTPIGVPTPVASSTAPTKSISTNVPSSQPKKTARAQSSSSSESESASDSDVEMTTPSALITPASQVKSAKSSMANGDRKRKHMGDEDQSTKRLKAVESTEGPGVKQKSTQGSKLGSTSDATPSKKPSKSKDKKETAKKNKTPNSAAMTPSKAKQTPIPLPSYPGMKH